MNIIKELEKVFLKNHNLMDNEKDKTKQSMYAYASLEIVDLLALYNNITEQQQLENLYNKYKLWKIKQKRTLSPFLFSKNYFFKY